MNTKRITLFILILVFLLTSLGFGYHTYSKIKSNTDDLNSIKIIKVKPKILLSTTGIQTPKQSYTFHFNSSLGQINRILVKNNEKISAKRPILEYYNSEKEIKVNSFKGVLNQIKLPTNAPSHLKDNPYLTAPQLYSQLLQEQNSIYTTQVSPINGNVSIINPHPAKTDDKVVQIDSEERVIHANISESEVNLLKINQNVSITTSDATQFISKVKSISMIPSEVKNHISYFQVVLTTQAKYPIGTHFKISLISNDIELPQSSIVDNKYVLVIHNKKIVKREINYKKSSKSGYIIVTSGLSINEKVVKSPSSKMAKAYNSQRL